MTTSTMTEPYVLHDSLGYQATLFARITERRFEASLTPLGLTRLYWCVLLATGQENLKFPSEIATFIGVDRTATSRALRQMEDRGLIQRKTGDKDRRTTEVLATPKGMNALATATKAARTNAKRYDNKLTSIEREALLGLIGKLLHGEDQDIANL